MVSTDQGDISIGQIVEEQISCKVLSYNHQQEILEYKAIEQYEKNPGKEILEIEFDDGSILECTPDHPIFIENKGYIFANEVQDGDICLSVLSERN
jgi:intein/homing endonuclease